MCQAMAALIVTIEYQYTQPLVLISGLLCIGACMIAVINATIHAWQERRHVEIEIGETDIIWIMESPPPSRSEAGPYPMTQSRPRKRAYRAGRARVGMHRRPMTRSYNPKAPNHCAYQSILRAMHRPTNMRAIQDLRDEVAIAFQKAYEENRSVLGFDLQELVIEENKSLHEYVQSIREQQWASQVEVALAAECAHASLLLCVKNQCTRLGQGEVRYALMYKDHHYTLSRIHRLREQSEGHGQHVARGGMQDMWTWEDPAGMSTEDVRIEDEVPSWAMSRTTQGTSMQVDMAPTPPPSGEVAYT